MRVWSLSSGSSGNCYLVGEDDSFLLLEAGLSAARVEMEMAHLGVPPSAVTAVLASHEHTDHWLSATRLARRWRVPVICSAGTLEAGGAGGTSPLDHLSLSAGAGLRIGGFTVEAFALPHDAREPTGFLVRTGSASLCLATDLGRATRDVVEHAREAELVILEANHDVDMLARGPYPGYLKARVTGGLGHISNVEAGRTVARIADDGPRSFWLAHLSHTNNSPNVALTTVREVLRLEGLSGLRLNVALRNRRSLFWDSHSEAPVAEQLRLF